MRKIIKGLVGIALAVSVALPAVSFAEEDTDKPEPAITWNAWGRALFVPVVSNENGETVPRDAASWGWDSRIGFTIKGESDRVGFWVDIKADTGNIDGLQDQQKIWVKPTDTVTVEVGPNVFYDELRGNSAFGSWDWMRFRGMNDFYGGEDNIFQRGQAGGGDGSVLRSKDEGDVASGAIVHMDTNGLHVFAALNVVEEGYLFQEADDSLGTEDVREQYTSAIMMKRGQYGVGYEIEGLGLVRAQYIGKAYAEEGKIYTEGDELESYSVINAALKVDQAIENLYFDVGVFFSTDDDAENHRIAAYAKYQMETITPHLLMEFMPDKEDAEGDEGLGMGIGLGADVDLGRDLILNVDLRYYNETAIAIEDVDNQIGFLVGLKKEFSNGLIGIGFQGTTVDWGDGVVQKEDVDDFAWAIPVKLEYWF